MYQNEKKNIAGGHCIIYNAQLIRTTVSFLRGKFLKENVRKNFFLCGKGLIHLQTQKNDKTSQKSATQLNTCLKYR